MKRSTTHKANPNEVVLIGLDTDDGPEHFLYQDRVKLEPTPEEIDAARNGVTIFYCTKLPGHELPVVVAGRQRTIAARAAGLEEVEFKLVKGTPAELATLMIQENALQKALTPIDKAKDAKALLALHLAEEVPEKEAMALVAQAFGQTVQSVKDYLTILDFDPKVLKAIEAKKISANEALVRLRKVAPEDQAGKLKEVLADKTAPKVRANGQPAPERKRNMDKAILKFMAGDEGSPMIQDEDSEDFDPATQAGMLVLEFVHNLATKAEVFRKVPGFKAAYDRAKRALEKE